MHGEYKVKSLLCCESEFDAFENSELSTTPLRMAQEVPKHM
jgi:hypothetical protein